MMTHVFLGHGADPNRTGKNNLALHMAVLHKHPEAMELLLRHGAAADKKDHTGDNALHLAVRMGNLEAARILLKHTPLIQYTRDSSNNTPLIIASHGNNLDMIHLLIFHSSPGDWQNRDGYTALIMAVYCNNKEIVKALLQRKACPLEKQEYSHGDTALHLAIKCNYVEIVRMLVEHGAPLDKQNQHRQTPIDIALIKNNQDIIKILQNAPAMQAAIFEREQKALNQSTAEGAFSEIVEKGDLQKAREFLDSETLENISKKKPVIPGWRELRIALFHEDKAMMRLLIKWGAKPTIDDLSSLAKMEKYPLYVHLLRQCGLEVRFSPKKDKPQQPPAP